MDRIVSRSLSAVGVLLLITATTQARIPPELAGNPLPDYPYFEYVQAHPELKVVWLAFDPSKIAGGMDRDCDIYITADKSEAEWTADPTLLDVRGAPNGQPETFSCTNIQDCTFALVGSDTLSSDAGCLNPTDASTCIGLGAGYDLVMDCNRDGVLGSADFIDGLGDEAGFYVVHDTSKSRLVVAPPYPYNVIANNPTGNEFDIPNCAFDSTCSADFDCGNQKLYYPGGVESMGASLPLIIISHGNGHCYDWYGDFATHLASYGYIVVSHQNNTLPNYGEFTADTTLRHTDAAIDLINGPDCATRVAPGHAAVCGKVDTSRIVWIGHSRGGWGVVRAHNLLTTGAYTPTNYSASSIALISSMAPIDKLDILADPGMVPYHLIWDSGDRDVDGAPTSNTLAFRLYERAGGFRQSVYLHGGAHGYFHDNCGDSSSDDCAVWMEEIGPDGAASGNELDEEGVDAVVRAYYVPLLKRYLEGNVPAEEFLWRPWEKLLRPILEGHDPPEVSPNSSVALEYKEPDGPGHLVIDDYESHFNLGMSSSGGSVERSIGQPGDDPAVIVEDTMEDADCHFDWDRTLGTLPGSPSFPSNGGFCSGGCAGSGRFEVDEILPGDPPCDLNEECQALYDANAQQPMNGATRSRAEAPMRGLALSWDASEYYELRLKNSYRDITDKEFLSFRVAQLPRHPLTMQELGNLDFSVALIDDNGTVSRVKLSTYSAGIVEPYHRGGPGDMTGCIQCGGQTCCSPEGCDPWKSSKGWQAEFETVRIRLIDFSTDGSGVGLDFSDMKAVRFEFGGSSGSAVGRILLDDIELTARTSSP